MGNMCTCSCLLIALARPGSSRCGCKGCSCAPFFSTSSSVPILLLLLTVQLLLQVSVNVLHSGWQGSLTAGCRGASLSWCRAPRLALAHATNEQTLVCSGAVLRVAMCCVYQVTDGQAHLIGLPAVARARAENDASVSVAAGAAGGTQSAVEQQGLTEC